MSTINGVVFKNMIYNGTAVKKWNHNGVEVFSAGSTVTYVCAGKYFTEEVDSGASVLSPTTFTPTLPGATFKGWSKSPSSATVETSLTMGSDPIVLYAVFKYADSAVSRQFYQKNDAFFPNDAETSGFYMTLVPSVNLAQYSGITITFDSVGLTQDWTTNTVYLTAKCGGGSVDLYSDYYDYTETHHKTATSGSKTLNFANSSGTDKCIIVFRGGGYCNGGSFGASGTLLGRTVVG